MYMIVLECIQEMNRSIFGFPVLMCFIIGNIAEIINYSYFHVLFGGIFMNYTKDPYAAVTHLSMKLSDVFLLYGACYSTDKEVDIFHFRLNY